MKKLLLTMSLSLAVMPVHADEMGPTKGMDLPPARTTPRPVAAPVEAAPAPVVAPVEVAPVWAPQASPVVELPPPPAATPEPAAAPVVAPAEAVPAAVVAAPAPVATKISDDQGGFWGRFKGQLSVGAMMGPTHNRDLLSDNNDGSLSGVSTDKIGTGGKLFVDWQPWEYVGFEAAYSDLGKNSFRGDASGGGPSWTIPGPVGTDHEANGWELSLLTRVPVSERLTLLLKGGAYGWNSKQTYYESGGTVVTEDKSSGTDLTYGVGFEYDVGVKNRFFWRGELQHYTVDEANLDSNALWIGIMYRR